MVRRLRRQGEVMQAGLAVALVAGGMWPRARCWAEGYGTDGLCPMCAMGAPDTVWHRCYECPYILGQGSKVLEDTNDLVEAAKAQRNDEEAACFWSRSIVPREWLKLERPQRSTRPGRWVPWRACQLASA